MKSCGVCVVFFLFFSLLNVRELGTISLWEVISFFLLLMFRKFLGSLVITVRVVVVFRAAQIFLLSHTQTQHCLFDI